MKSHVPTALRNTVNLFVNYKYLKYGALVMKLPPILL
jgi:hypothetical protein